jgi:thiamine biosynthesis lipoprotein ApbE
VRPDAVVRVVELASGGVATSAAYGGISELWGRRGGVRWPGSVSVIAPSCAVADAFTKVAALDPGAEALFARWGARVLLLSRKDAA